MIYEFEIERFDGRRGKICVDEISEIEAELRIHRECYGIRRMNLLKSFPCRRAQDIPPALERRAEATKQQELK